MPTAHFSERLAPSSGRPLGIVLLKISKFRKKKRAFHLQMIHRRLPLLQHHVASSQRRNVLTLRFCEHSSRSSMSAPRCLIGAEKPRRMPKEQCRFPNIIGLQILFWEIPQVTGQVRLHFVERGALPAYIGHVLHKVPLVCLVPALACGFLVWVRQQPELDVRVPPLLRGGLLVLVMGAAQCAPPLISQERFSLS